MTADDDDDAEGGDEGNEGGDDTGDENAEGNEDNPEGGEDDNPEGGEEDVDDMTDDENGDEADDDAEGEDDGAGDDIGGGNDLKSKEKDLFRDLQPAQINIMNGELLQNYMDMYETIGTIFDNINKIPKTYSNTRILEFVGDKLTDLKSLVNQIITNTYVTKTYIENLTIYKQCLLVLHQINNILKNMVSERDLSNKEKDRVENNKRLLEKRNNHSSIA